jgi:hypothetical protein
MHDGAVNCVLREAEAASGPDVISRSYLARRTGLPKATTNRVVARLVAARLLEECVEQLVQAGWVVLGGPASIRADSVSGPAFVTAQGAELLDETQHSYRPFRRMCGA